MHHTWLHREPVLNTTYFYLQTDKVSITNCLQLADPDTTIDFRSIGGYDANDTWMEHSIIYNNPERKSPLSLPLQVYDLKEKPASILVKLESIPFSIALFAFECSDMVWMRGDSQYGQANIEMHFPLAEESKWMKRIGEHFPFLKDRTGWEQPDSIYYVVDGQQVKAGFPDVRSLQEFQSDDFNRIMQRFNQYTL